MPQPRLPTLADHDVDNFGLNFIVLAISFVVEGFSCVVAVRALSEGAERRGVTFAEYLDSGSDPAAVAVMAEDGAAVMGVTIAAISNWLVKATDWQAWDGVGSILVGVLLSFVALFLIQRNRAVLIGRSMAADELATVIAYLYQDPVVNHVYDARSEEIGPGVYRFSAELDFDGEKIAERHLKTVNPQQLAHKFFNTQNPGDSNDTRAFSIALREYGAQLVRAVGSEVDRIEGDIQNLVPGVQYVDLEADRGRFWLYRASVDGDDDIRERFDISQLSLDAVAWQSEETKINYLLSMGPDGKGAPAADGPAAAQGPAVTSSRTDAAGSNGLAADLAEPAGSVGAVVDERRGPVDSGVRRAEAAGASSHRRDSETEAGGGDAVTAGDASVIAWGDAGDYPAAVPAVDGNGAVAAAGRDAATSDRGAVAADSQQDTAQQGVVGQMTVRVGAASRTGQVVDVELSDGDATGDQGALPAPVVAEEEFSSSESGAANAGGAATPVAEEVAVGAKGSRQQ